MYVWIWRTLPGNWAGKLAGTLVLLAGAGAVLVFLVFPWAEPRLPWNNVNVDQPAVSNSSNVDQTGSPGVTISPTSTVIIHPRATPHA
jgi:hypothetical protein